MLHDGRGRGPPAGRAAYGHDRCGILEPRGAPDSRYRYTGRADARPRDIERGRAPDLCQGSAGSAPPVDRRPLWARAIDQPRGPRIRQPPTPSMGCATGSARRRATYRRSHHSAPRRSPASGPCGEAATKVTRSKPRPADPSPGRSRVDRHVLRSAKPGGGDARRSRGSEPIPHRARSDSSATAPIAAAQSSAVANLPSVVRIHGCRALCFQVLGTSALVLAVGTGFLPPLPHLGSSGRVTAKDRICTRHASA